MKQRHLYLILFAAPALLAALVAGMALFGAAAGVLWLFVYGDEPWPSWTEGVLVAVFGLVALAIWAWLLSLAHAAGMKREAGGDSRTAPFALAAGATLLLLGAIVLQQWRVGNIGPKSPGLVCAEYCAAQGFAASGMPPRDAGPPVCNCLDEQGRTARSVPLGEAPPGRAAPSR